MSDTSYPIFLTDTTLPSIGDIFDVSVANSVAETTLTTLNLLRRGARGYAEAASENFVHLLENFASPPQGGQGPMPALKGQLWYDSGNQRLKLYDGANYNLIVGLASSLQTPVTISLHNGNVSGAVLGSAVFDGASDVAIPFNLPPTNVIAGTYDFSTITVDSQGRITSASSGSVPTLGYIPADDSLVVHKSGDTMTGTLQVNADVITTGNGKLKQEYRGAYYDLLPAGAIIMWNGVIAPGGWGLCDGHTTAEGVVTPDLRDRFVVGLGLSYGLGNNGGVASNVLNTDVQGGHTHTGIGDTAGSHTHGGAVGQHVLSINEMPSHTHGVQMGGGDHGTTVVADGSGSSAVVNTTPVGGNVGHDHPINSDGAHIHNIVINAVAGHTHSLIVDRRPPYYALAYIMKL